MSRTRWVSSGGGPASPNQIWVDSGWFQSKESVYEASRRFRGYVRPVKGYGMGQQRDRIYKPPTKRSKSIIHVGLQYHATRMREDRIDLVHINADFWKTWVHERLAQPIDQPGSVCLYDSPDRNEHITFAKHMTSEKAERRFVPGRGDVQVWVRKSRVNHLLDCFYIAAAASHLSGARLIEDFKKPATQQRSRTTRPVLKAPGGLPFVATERSI